MSPGRKRWAPEQQVARAQALEPLLRTLFLALATDACEEQDIWIDYVQRESVLHLQVRVPDEDYFRLRGADGHVEKALHVLMRAWAKGIPLHIDLILPEQQLREEFDTVQDDTSLTAEMRQAQQVELYERYEAVRATRTKAACCDHTKGVASGAPGTPQGVPGSPQGKLEI